MAGDGACLLGQRFVAAAFRGGDVDQPHQIGGDTAHEPDPRRSRTARHW
jgi:hypothetical protein